MNGRMGGEGGADIKDSQRHGMRITPYMVSVYVTKQRQEIK